MGRSVVILVLRRDGEAENGIQISFLQFLGQEGVLDGDSRLAGQGKHQVLETPVKSNNALAFARVDELEHSYHVAGSVLHRHDQHATGAVIVLLVKGTVEMVLAGS